MVATVTLRQCVGGSDGSPASESGDLHSTGSIRLQTKDQIAPTDTTYPVPIPAASFNYSYWIHLYLKIDSGTFTSITNVKFWSDGTIGWNYGTGGSFLIGNRDAGDIGCAMDTEYDVATGTESTTGHAIDDVADGHGFYNSQTLKTRSVGYWTSGGKATVDSTTHSSAEKCKAVVLQAKVASDATQGEQTDETVYVSYDEI